MMSIGMADAVDTSSLDLIVPEDSTFDLEDFLQPGPENETHGRHIKRSLSTVPQRDVLHFGMWPTPIR